MVRYCLHFGVPGCFLTLQAKAGLTASVLAELVRMQQSTALGAGQNAGTPEAVAAARYTGAGCIYVKSWGDGKSCCMSPYIGYRDPDYSPFHD
jgi:hypothetical protein